MKYMFYVYFYIILYIFVFFFSLKFKWYLYRTPSIRPAVQTDADQIDTLVCMQSSWRGTFMVSRVMSHTMYPTMYPTSQVYRPRRIEMVLSKDYITTYQDIAGALDWRNCVTFMESVW